MVKTPEETSLVATLCGEILSASELKVLCRTRGFPVAGADKGAMVRSASARFLEPSGLSQAMSSLEPRWLGILHVLAAGGPLSLRRIGQLFEPGRSAYAVDLRSFWKTTTTSLLSRGVVLVEDHAAEPGENSRYARYHVRLPAGFAEHLPAFPLESERVEGQGARGSIDETYARALALMAGAEARHQGDELPRRLAAAMSLKEGHLTFPDLDRLDGASVARMALRHLGAAIEAKAEERPPAGAVALRLLGGLGEGMGCSAASLASALTGAGYPLKPSVLEGWLDEGVACGAVVRFARASRPALFRRSPEDAMRGQEALKLASSAKGARVVTEETALISLLQAAEVSRVSASDGALLIEPDPIRLGRGWKGLPPVVQQGLRKGSKAFQQAAELVESRAGQVLVHKGLAVLKIDDAGLFALLEHRFPGAVRALDGRYLACLQGRLGEVLALARKEGYVARHEA